MQYPVSLQWPITAPYNEQRPLNATEKSHIHGAIDIGCPIGTDIWAPEKGQVYYQFLIRKGSGYQNLYWEDGNLYAFRNYFYDTFGGLIIVEGEETGLTHVFAHIYVNQLFNKPWALRRNYDFKEVEKDDILAFNFLSKEHKVSVENGEKIGESGNAGFSTGAHIHYEIHRGRSWEKHEERVDPEKLHAELRLRRV